MQYDDVESDVNPGNSDDEDHGYEKEGEEQFEDEGDDDMYGPEVWLFYNSF